MRYIRLSEHFIRCINHKPCINYRDRFKLYSTRSHDACSKQYCTKQPIKHTSCSDESQAMSVVYRLQNVNEMLHQGRTACLQRAVRGSLKIQDAKKSHKIARHLGTIAQLCRAVFATKACTDNRKKLVKQQYVFQMSPQYGELRPTSG